MKFIDYIETQNILLNIPFRSKKRLFEQLAKLMSGDESPRIIYNALVKREKLGATSLGNGVALPHANCLKNKEVKISVFVLNKPVNYESVDENFVQVIVCVLFPKLLTESHYQMLKLMGKFFKKHRIYRDIIQAKSAEEIKSIIMDEGKTKKD